MYNVTMDLVTLIGLLAACCSILSVAYLIFRKLRSLFQTINARLVALEDALKIREELIAKEDFVTKHLDNTRLYTIAAGTKVHVTSVDGDKVSFVTDDKLITGQAAISYFKKPQST